MTAPAQPAAPQQQRPPKDGQTRELWITTKAQYRQAIEEARAIWGADAQPIILNAAAATLLEHFCRLRFPNQPRPQGPPQRPGGPQRAKPPAGGYTGPVPICPWCQSAMYDNRNSKKSPAMPDFRCKQEQGPCVDGQGRVHGLWIKGGKLQLPDIEQEQEDGDDFGY